MTAWTGVLAMGMAKQSGSRYCLQVHIIEFAVGLEVVCEKTKT